VRAGKLSVSDRAAGTATIFDRTEGPTVQALLNRRAVLKSS